MEFPTISTSLTCCYLSHTPGIVKVFSTHSCDWGLFKKLSWHPERWLSPSSENVFFRFKCHNVWWLTQVSSEILTCYFSDSCLMESGNLPSNTLLPFVPLSLAFSFPPPPSSLSDFSSGPPSFPPVFSFLVWTKCLQRAMTHCDGMYGKKRRGRGRRMDRGGVRRGNPFLCPLHPR